MRKSMRNNGLVLLTAATVIFSACTKDGPDVEAPPRQDTDRGAPRGMLGEAAEKAKTDTAAASLPQPDLGKPASEYPRLESGIQIMFHYVAASNLPPDYPKLAQAYSKEYRGTSDTFRKNDLLHAIKPKLDQEISQAKANPYGWMRVSDADLGSYDFDRKGFPVGEFADSRTRYFHDSYDYKIGWANYSQLAFAPVADEAVARRIESMRSSYADTPQLNVFFFAQSADLNDQKINGVVTQAQIIDKSGRVLASYGPDESVAPSVLEDTVCQGNPIDCAAGAVDL